MAKPRTRFLLIQTVVPLFAIQMFLPYKCFKPLVWPPYGIRQAIIFLPCGFFVLSSFFPRLISAVAEWMSTTWCGFSANLECRSEMCCTRLAENTGRKNDAKNRHLGTIAHLCRAVSLQLRHVSTVGKKLVKQQYLLHMSPTIW